ncbi:DNA-3-methyladenine glycosylase I [Lutimonas halocynthiae]|uniref:DNA-3-methyladenine glycosylase I n=1 Tax=Lutimonas halocynthiae TaxID=1446477 RepID=UPI0025B4F17F|nr:DNA-3-methyladenine glycosylase I [Lutimonas halocynthiae]MDN3642625.1 DNA-3-methyladenine glycosylase I [Lutimonas halocynthiae]
MDKSRCDWCGNDPLYMSYHDHEWGVPLFEDKILFEFLILETFQAGLSWITILRKRENFRQAFDDFDYLKIAHYDEAKYEELLMNTGIIRNKLKIRSAISNAQLFIEIQKEYGSFSNYFWSFTDNQSISNQWDNMSQVPATTDLSDTISKALKKKGFKFVGSTVIYAYMQAIGMVNDHVSSCFRYEQIKSEAL